MILQERIRGLYRAPKLLAQVMLGNRYDFLYDQMPISIRRMSLQKRINLIRAGLNLIHRRLRPWSMPLHMQFELVNYCQLRCPVCPAGIHEIHRKPQVMDPGLFRKVLQEAGPHLLTLSLWGWGESLLHPELREFLCEARRYNTTILLSTNGQDLNKDEVIKTILENPPTFLIVAIDGLTDESNAKFRIGARLDPILQGIRRLSEAKKLSGQTFPILHMRFIVMKHNQHELPETAAFASKNGFDLLTVRTLSPINSESGRRFHIQMGTDLPEFNTHPDDSGNPAYRKNYICMQPFWYPSLYADGTLVACEQDFNAVQPLGVLNEGLNFSKIWFSSAAAAVRRQIRDESSDLPFCARCPNCYRPMTDTSVSATWLYSGIRRPVIPEGGIHVK